MTRFMTEMELRVAKAMCCTRHWMECIRPTACDCLDYINATRAAIRAMRTPTTEMLREAGMVVAGNTEAHAAVWEAMIDAASPQEE